MSYNAIVPQTSDSKIPYDLKGERVSAKGGTIDKATQKALALAGRDYNALINGTVTMYHYDFILFYNVVYKVEGTPIKLK
ncbi:MAG: hypothetical protein M0D57_04530 [Sphingobacteriales bacterium JAD_PAG50586_3]|nr:MAG: hypothetical protein M0D57_04530 [Sphingobacteriales bacterium JAD_PAG50586_3]